MKITIEEGLTQKEILLEISVALINEGCRLRYLVEGASVTEETNTQKNYG
jgi:hypothetical protein